MMPRTVLKVRKDQFNGRRYYEDQRTGVKYRRLVGGIAWPFGSDDGACVVLVESYSPDFETQRQKVFRLEEFVSPDINTMLKWVHACQTDIYVVDWITPRESLYMELLHQYNDDLARLRRPTISAYSPPQWDRQESLRYYLRLLERRVRTEKTIHFGDVSIIRDQCVALAKSTDNHYRRLEEFPGPAALLYALAEIDLRPPDNLPMSNRYTGDQMTGY